ncbi:NADH dehydrogenase [ubiquinone] 1 alpha subcomplex assembly factor 8 [Triplophysa tibetana]|uniref:NADH dehydrogenase [ubiquinone] 1 alpha subcomplex assembly factor 8 n=1 Tax=Triplophysa tibetana TaxID=1572043 RepID=A0A5A9PRV7_9TELE|nr:NADH dehydrogenase [ubiquinone] 1 alpha subcomplex assembly factor 8 [Triplophysa tibetana]
MSGSNVWTRSGARLRLFPEMFAQCSAEAAFYGKCVATTTTGKQELTKNMCAKEFGALKSCFQSAVSLSVNPSK